MTLSEQISEELKNAMRAKDEVRLRTLRSIRAEILKIEKEGKGSPDDAGVVAAIQRLAKQRQDSIDQFGKAGREDLVANETAELEILHEFLPEALAEEEIDRIVEEVLEQTGASSPQDVGKVMGPLMGRLKKTGKVFDGAAVNAKVRARLGG
jgi:uncharacterized protein YqeY